MNKSENKVTDDLYKFENLKIYNYNHGGSRIMLEQKNNREIICDTYGDNTELDSGLRLVIHQAIKDFFAILNAPCKTCIHLNVCKNKDNVNIECEDYYEKQS